MEIGVTTFIVPSAVQPVYATSSLGIFPSEPCRLDGIIGDGMQLTDPLASDSKRQEPTTKTQKKYVYDNDGHFGAFISYLILQKYVGKNLLGVSLTNGDSLTPIATQSFRKLFYAMNAIPHFAVNDKEVPNPFPSEWRAMSHEFDAIIKRTCENEAETPPRTFNQFMSETVKHLSADEQVTIIATGPLTNIAALIESNDPSISRIGEIIIMGGAITVGGNVVKSKKSDGSAEWNFFADPQSAKTVLRSGIPVTLVPLDTTNVVPITPEFISQVAEVGGVAARLTHSLLQYAYSKYPSDYYLWEPLAVLCALMHDATKIEQKKLDVITRGQSQGRVIMADGGTSCNVVVNIDRKKILRLFFSALSE